MPGLTLDIKLLPWQEQVWADTTRFKVVAAGRRTGKTRLAAWTLVVNALQTKKGHVFYVAPTQGAARDILWKELLELAHPVIAGSHVNNMQVTLINGTIISLKGADRPETMRGVSLKYVVIDEYATIKPDVWELILRPALSDQKGGALFIGTPAGRSHFYELYKYAELSKDNDWKAWHFTSFDNPLIDPDEIEAAKRSMSSFAFKQEYLASFDAQGSEIFKEDWIQYGEDPGDGDYYVAIDLAGFTEVGKSAAKSTRLDDSAICVVKVTPTGDWWIDTFVQGRWTLDETAKKIFDVIAKYRPVSVGIEKGIARQAVMSPLSDLQRRYNKYFNVKELTHGNQRKVDRVVWALQGRFEHGRITLNKGDWNEKFLDQLFSFPSPLVHDDLPDALAYIDQLALTTYGVDEYQNTDFIPLDVLAGY